MVLCMALGKEIQQLPLWCEQVQFVECFYPYNYEARGDIYQFYWELSCFSSDYDVADRKEAVVSLSGERAI
jgi:hypothetical protein